MARSERIAIALALGLAIPAVASCRGIVGLDDFRRGECPGALCADDGGTVDVVVPDAADAGDARPDAPKGADPVSWARWKMPNYPNDAGAPNVPTYTVVGGGDQVTDNVTGLVWQTKPLAQQATQADSVKACTGLPN